MACGDDVDETRDSGVGADAGNADAGNADAALPSDSGIAGDAGVSPLPEGVPGGPRSAAPVVGCEDAERPAQRDEASVPVCEAIGAGRCWYISPEGDDANPGTFEAPFGTPQQAVRQAGPGDVIYLRGGVYDERNSHAARAYRWDDESAGTERAFISVRRISLPGWAGGERYTVSSGTEEAPITIRSFPGERACASGAGNINIGPNGEDNGFWRIEDITLRGARIGVGGGSGDATNPTNQVHDIWIRNNEVYGYTIPGGDNPGLVRIDRGDGGGPSRIVVESNILHDLIPIDPDGVTRDWATAMDAQHFGAVTTLSCETYLGAECGGNGALTIQNNLIYHSPQAFFFKNPSAGPFTIRGNVIRDVGSLGSWAPSNIVFTENLVVRGGGGIRLGSGNPNTGEVFERQGHNFTAQNNTFIGRNSFLELRDWATGHTSRGNVFQGLTLGRADRSWNNMGLIYQGLYARETAPADIGDAQIATNDFDDNCFVTDTPDFLLYGRRYSTDSGRQLDHLTLDEARTRLGHDVESDVANTASAFVNFDGGDYRIADDGPCAGRGAPVPEWASDVL